MDREREREKDIRDRYRWTERVREGERQRVEEREKDNRDRQRVREGESGRERERERVGRAKHKRCHGIHNRNVTQGPHALSEEHQSGFRKEHQVPLPHFCKKKKQQNQNIMPLLEIRPPSWIYRNPPTPHVTQGTAT